MSLPKTPTMTHEQLIRLLEYCIPEGCLNGGSLAKAIDPASLLEWIAENLKPEEIYGQAYMDEYANNLIADYVSDCNDQKWGR